MQTGNKPGRPQAQWNHQVPTGASAQMGDGDAMPLQMGQPEGEYRLSRREVARRLDEEEARERFGQVGKR